MPRKEDAWSVAPRLIEHTYTFEDALCMAFLMHTMLRHADRLKIACMAQLVNVIAPIMTVPGGGTWVQSIYWPLQRISEYGRGESILPVLRSPKGECRTYGDVDLLDASCIRHDDGSLTLFVASRAKEAIELDVDLRSAGDVKVTGHEVMHCDDLGAYNTVENPDAVSMRSVPCEKMDAGKLSLHISPTSWHVIQLA